MKNNVITAAIIGSLICCLLIVIAIGCACKLMVLRHMEHYRNVLTNSFAPIQNNDFSFPVTAGDLDASLFRLDSSFFFREPPPSYASTMGGYSDLNSSANSYMEQYRRYRRQRRCRRILRRQNRQLQSTRTNENDNIEEDVSTSDNSCLSHVNSVITSNVISSPDDQNASGGMDNLFKKNDNVDSNKLIPTPQSVQANNSSSNYNNNYNNSIPTTSLISNSSSIELEPILPLTNSDCDFQPLIK